MLLSNSVGVLDSGYRGEVFFKFKPSLIVSNNDYGDDADTEFFDSIDIPDERFDFEFLHYKVGERIGQIIILPYPQITFEEVEELSQTERGSGGFGHTGTRFSSGYLG